MWLTWRDLVWLFALRIVSRSSLRISATEAVAMMTLEGLLQAFGRRESDEFSDGLLPLLHRVISDCRLDFALGHQADWLSIQSQT